MIKDNLPNILEIALIMITIGGFAQDIECDCDLIDGPHFVKKCAGKKGGRISKRR